MVNGKLRSNLVVEPGGAFVQMLPELRVSPGAGSYWPGCEPHNPSIFAAKRRAFDKWFLLEWEFDEDPATITIWIDGQRLTNAMNGEKVHMVKFGWPKGGTNNTALVDRFGSRSPFRDHGTRKSR